MDLCKINYRRSLKITLYIIGFVCFSERYRDLMSAADTIADMKQTASEVGDSIVNISHLVSTVKSAFIPYNNHHQNQ